MSVSEWNIFPDGVMPLVAGPCSAESAQQVLDAARGLYAAGCRVLRAGAWKPRTRPGCFEGFGEEALKWMKEAKEATGMKTATEVAGASHVELALKYGVDLLWIGARTTGNPFLVQEIADALAGVDIPVLVKNPMNPDRALWEGALERLASRGVNKVGVIHRGFTPSSKIRYRNDPMWSVALEFRAANPEIPVFVDPSHMGGSREYLQALSQRAVDLGFDGLMIESHPDPAAALSDAAQQLTPAALSELLSNLSFEGGKAAFERSVAELREKIDLFDEDLLNILSRRIECCREIGRIKKNSGIEVYQPERWDKVAGNAAEAASELKLDVDFVAGIFNTIHDYSKKEQTKIIEQ